MKFKKENFLILSYLSYTQMHHPSLNMLAQYPHVQIDIQVEILFIQTYASLFI